MTSRRARKIDIGIYIAVLSTASSTVSVSKIFEVIFKVKMLYFKVKLTEFYYFLPVFESK